MGDGGPAVFKVAAALAAVMAVCLWLIATVGCKAAARPSRSAPLSMPAA